MLAQLAVTYVWLVSPEKTSPPSMEDGPTRTHTLHTIGSGADTRHAVTTADLPAEFTHTVLPAASSSFPDSQKKWLKSVTLAPLFGHEQRKPPGRLLPDNAAEVASVPCKATRGTVRAQTVCFR